MAGDTINFDASASSGRYIDAKIEWSSSANTSANTSALIVSLYVRKGDTTQTLTIPTSGTWNYTLTIDGGKVSGAVELSVLEDWVLVASKSIGGLKHDDNGAKSITIAGSVTAPSATSFSGHTSSGSGKATFDTIPRATSIDSLTCSTNYFDGTLTYKYTPKSASYYNRCNISLNINGNYIAVKTINSGKKSTTQQTGQVKLSDDELQKIYDNLPNTTKGVLRFTFRTYSDSGYSSQVGNVSYKELSLTIPTSIKPTASLTLESSNSNTWISSLGIYVQNYSGVKATLSGEAGDGATVKAYQVTNGDYSSETNILKISKITTSGNMTITGRITDSRGRTAEVSKTINVLPYAAPAISKLEVTRGVYSGGWTANETGKDIKITFKASLALLDQGNTYSATFKLGNAAMSPSSGTTSGLASGVDRTVYLLNLDGESSYTLTFTAKDRVGNSNVAKVTIPTFNVTIEFNDSGKGIAFGKTSEKDAFECAWPAYFSDAIYVADKITCTNDFAARDFNINCNWKDGAGHDILVREKDGLTTGLGWSGSGDDGKSYDTVLDVRPKQVNFRGIVTAPRGRFTKTTDLSGTEQNDVALRTGDEAGQHIDIDSNEIQAKESPTTPGNLHLNLEGGNVYAGGFRIPEIQYGSVSITPSAANTPTSLGITFEKPFTGKPIVVVTPATAAPGTTVLGAGVNGISATGCTLWVSRTNTTSTVLNWIAIY